MGSGAAPQVPSAPLFLLLDEPPTCWRKAATHAECGREGENAAPHIRGSLGSSPHGINAGRRCLCGSHTSCRSTSHRCRLSTGQPVIKEKTTTE